MNHNFCSNCVHISNFQMAVKPKPFNGIFIKKIDFFSEISSNLGSKNKLGLPFFESKLLEISKKNRKKYEKRIMLKMDLFLSLKYGAIPYNGLGLTAI